MNAPARRRLLWICSRLPYPPHRGDRLLGWGALHALAARHHVRVLSLVDGSEPPDAPQRMLEVCERADVVHLPRWRSWLQAWAGLPGPDPSQVSYYRSLRMAHLVRQTIAEWLPEAIFVQMLRLAPLVANVEHPCKVLLLTDSIAMALGRSKAFQPAWKRPGVEWERRRVERFEVAMTRRFRESWLVSDLDREELLSRGAVRLATVANGIDDRLLEMEHHPADPPVITFLGNLSVPHNVDAARFAAEEIWPLVLARVPRARLSLVGADAVPAVTRLGELPGVEVRGFVDDPRDIWRGSSALLAPLRFSSGVQNKALDAMAAGVPVVTTSAVAAGLHLPDGEEILTGETARELAGAVIATLTDREAAACRAARARAHVRAHHAWSGYAERIEALLAESPPA